MGIHAALETVAGGAVGDSGHMVPDQGEEVGLVKRAGVEAILSGHCDQSLLVEQEEGGGISAGGERGLGHDGHTLPEHGGGETQVKPYHRKSYLVALDLS